METLTQNIATNCLNAPVYKTKQTRVKKAKKQECWEGIDSSRINYVPFDSSDETPNTPFFNYLDKVVAKIATSEKDIDNAKIANLPVGRNKEVSKKYSDFANKIQTPEIVVENEPTVSKLETVETVIETASIAGNKIDACKKLTVLTKKYNTSVDKYINSTYDAGKAETRLLFPANKEIEKNCNALIKKCNKLREKMEKNKANMFDFYNIQCEIETPVENLPAVKEKLTTENTDEVTYSCDTKIEAAMSDPKPAPAPKTPTKKSVVMAFAWSLWRAKGTNKWVTFAMCLKTAWRSVK